MYFLQQKKTTVRTNSEQGLQLRVIGRGDLEDIEKVGDFKKLLAGIRHPHQLQLRLFVGGGSVSRDQLAYPSAVDVNHLLEINNDPLDLFCKKIADRTTQRFVQSGRNQLSLDLNDGHFSILIYFQFH